MSKSSSGYCNLFLNFFRIVRFSLRVPLGKKETFFIFMTMCFFFFINNCVLFVVLKKSRKYKHKLCKEHVTLCGTVIVAVLFIFVCQKVHKHKIVTVIYRKKGEMLFY
jgi:hypothetical protein